MASATQLLNDDSLLATLPWQHDRAVPLRHSVMRLTAPNPGMMTGPGTNSYIVGTRASGYIVIDPGPNHAPHIQRLFDATQGDIRGIVCTHSHADHAPAAKPLQTLCSTSSRTTPPILGLPSGPHARANAQFAPDKTLQNKELIRLISRQPDGDTTHTLQVIHTPGHAANHLCLVLLEEALLFSGDHILNGSTTVIDPPDGHMGDYLDSLDALTAVCTAHQIAHILPAHGHVLDQALRVIAHLKAHRLGREAKIAGVMQAHPAGTLDDWVAKAYDDAPPRLWPVAKRSLLAHVQRIRSQL